MPHQCVRCNTFFEDASTDILKGCKCGGKLFFFVKKERMEELKKAERNVNLSKDQKDQIENDVFDMIGADIDRTAPVVLDFESIRIAKPGQYELDLVSMFKDDPLIFRLEEGKYMIDIAESFNALTKKKKK